MSYAIRGYETAANELKTAQELEYDALLRINRLLEQGRTSADMRTKGLVANNRLWTLFLNRVDGIHAEGVLRSDLLKIGRWATRYSVNALNSDAPVDPLIEINLNLAEGLVCQGVG